MNYEIKKRSFLRVLLASLICFLFFLGYGLLANNFDFKIEILDGLWFLLFPISSLLIVIFSTCFFLTKPKKDIKYHESNK